MTPLSHLSVPVDALANKLFGAPEPSTIARSLPTTVPDSPNYRIARTPRTPRTPHRKDPAMTPRFYPVVKESWPVDAKVTILFLTFCLDLHTSRRSTRVQLSIGY